MEKDLVNWVVIHEFEFHEVGSINFTMDNPKYKDCIMKVHKYDRRSQGKWTNYYGLSSITSNDFTVLEYFAITKDYSDQEIINIFKRIRRLIMTDMYEALRDSPYFSISDLMD